MKILFIHCEGSWAGDDQVDINKPLAAHFFIQYGISYISAVLKANGHQSNLIVLAEDTPEEKVFECIASFNPQVVCFTAVYRYYYFITAIARAIKKRFPDLYLLAGGPHVTLNPEEAILDAFDAICIGEGEFPTLELVQQLSRRVEPQRIKNLWIKKRGWVERTPTRSYIQDLDALPYPDREMWKPWIKHTDGMIQTIIVGRGCPFLCTYCCNHALAKIAPDKYVRFRSPESIVAEVEHLIVRFPNMTHINFELEALNVNQQYFKAFCTTLKKFQKSSKNTLTFETNIRIVPQLDLEGIMNDLKAAGFTFIKIGLESGSEKIRTGILKRHYSNEDVIKATQLAKKCGIQTMLYILIGIPGETLADFKETVAVTKQCQPDHVQANIFAPYPGTVLHKFCKENHLLPDDYVTSGRGIATLDLPGFSREEIQQEYADFYVNVFGSENS